MRNEEVVDYAFCRSKYSVFSRPQREVAVARSPNRGVRRVSFAQRPERARHASLINFGGRSGTVFLQGVAWIDPVTYGIMRMRTDILKEVGGTGLRKETTDVEYAVVTFKQGNRSMWLPQEVTVNGELRGYVFHNRHRYSDYRLFSVQTEEKPKSP